MTCFYRLSDAVVILLSTYMRYVLLKSTIFVYVFFTRQNVLNITFKQNLKLIKKNKLALNKEMNRKQIKNAAIAAFCKIRKNFVFCIICDRYHILIAFKNQH